MESPGTGTGGPAMVTGDTVLIILTVRVLLKIFNNDTLGTGGLAVADKRDSSDNTNSRFANYNLKQEDIRNRNSSSITCREERQL